MNNESFTVDASMDRKRIDHILAERFPDHSRSYLQRMMKRGQVLINGAARKSGTLFEGEVVTIDWPDEKPLTLDAEQIDLPVLFEDKHMLVINKPPGMVVHPAPGNREGTIVNALLGYDYEQFSQMIDQEERPGIVHRLDKDTSGVLVVARTPAAKAKLSEAFSERKVSKTYLAIIRGRLARPEIHVENRIGRHPIVRKRMAVVDSGGKEAISTFTRFHSSDAMSLIKADIFTGRTHQIRVHLQDLACPIVGDDLYGGKQGEIKAPRQMLHAWKLTIPHPASGSCMEFTAPVPDDFQPLLRQIGDFEV